jgi:hypothetical protein
MKNLSLLLALALLPASTFAASSFENATEAATAAYRADFKAEKGLDAPEPVGFRLESEEDEVLTTVYFLDGSNLRATIYGCHQHGAQYDCHKEDRAELGAYRRSTNLYSAAEMKKSVGLALEFFGKNVAPVETIQSLKLWEAEENIRFIVAYKKQNSDQVFFQACHYHGKEMDCHRKRDAGPGEPAKK